MKPRVKFAECSIYTEMFFFSCPKPQNPSKRKNFTSPRRLESLRKIDENFTTGDYEELLSLSLQDCALKHKAKVTQLWLDKCGED